MNIAKAAGIAVCVLALAVAARPGEAQQAPVRVPASVLERYVGEYVDPDGAAVMVRLRGETLFREVAGQQVAYVPVSDTLFQLGTVFTAQFVVDEAGRVKQILSDGVDIEIHLTRKVSGAAASLAPPTAAPAPAAAAVRVRRSVLERYVGVYEYVPGQMERTDLSIVVRLKGDTLTRWMGQREVVLTPVSETRFRVGSTSLMVEFVVDEGGVMQILGSGRQQMLARRNPNRALPGQPRR